MRAAKPLISGHENETRCRFVLTTVAPCFHVQPCAFQQKTKMSSEATNCSQTRKRSGPAKHRRTEAAWAHLERLHPQLLVFLHDGLLLLVQRVLGVESGLRTRTRIRACNHISFCAFLRGQLAIRICGVRLIADSLTQHL